MATWWKCVLKWTTGWRSRTGIKHVSSICLQMSLQKLYANTHYETVKSDEINTFYINMWSVCHSTCNIHVHSCVSLPVLTALKKIKCAKMLTFCGEDFPYTERQHSDMSIALMHFQFVVTQATASELTHLPNIFFLWEQYFFLWVNWYMWHHKVFSGPLRLPNGQLHTVSSSVK